MNKLLLLFFLIPLNLFSQTCDGMIVKSLSSPANCYGGNGKILLTKVDGGTRPYSYKWSNGYDQQNLTAKAGKYTVIVTDANGCKKILTDSILQPTQIDLQTAFSPILCPGGSSQMTNTVVGGFPPYTFVYFDHLNKPFISNSLKVNAGAYRVRVIDSKGCTKETVGFIKVVDTVKPIEIIDSVKLASTKTASNGAIYVRLKNGTLPFQYSWSNNKTTANITQVKAGDYTLTVTDKNRCIQKKIITVGVSNKREIEDEKIEPKLGQSYPNPLRSATVIEYIVPKNSKPYLELVYQSYSSFITTFDLDPDKTSIEIYKGNLPEGVYIYRLVVDGKLVDAKKLLIKD